MFGAAVLAAAECRIDDLSSLINDPELRKYWKLILSSIPETFHIDKYKHIIPKPTSIKNGSSFDENNTLFNNEQNIFYDSVESISQWSIERCFHIVKNTLSINEFAFPFLTFMIQHLGFEILNQGALLSDLQKKYLVSHYDSILMLYSFYSILEQYRIFIEKNTKSCKQILLDPVNFILNSPINRFKMVIEQFLDSSYSELSSLLSTLFGSYYSISYLNSLYDKQLSKDNLKSTKILKCQPLVQKYSSSGYFKQFYCKNTNFSYKCENNLKNSLLLNANTSLEEAVIDYLFDVKDDITVDFFCKISKILIKNSKLTKHLTKRYITCPIRVIQFILLCINGRESPLLNVNALEIQEYVDEIYECTPKSAIIIKHLKKDLIVRELNSSILKIDDQHSSDYICCPFCKNVSVLYQGQKSIQSFRNWLNNIFFSIESIEKHQLFIDICRELPIKIIKEITIYDIHKILYNPFNAECFLINLITKLPTFYTTDALNAIISLYKIIINSIKLPTYPLGSLINLLFYLLEKILITEDSKIEIITRDLMYHIKENITSINEHEFKNLFLKLFNHIYCRYSEEPLYNFSRFANILSKEIVLENRILNSQFRSISENIYISNIINELIKFSPKKTEINSIFKVCSESELEKVIYSRHCNNFEFIYYHPNSVILEDKKENILVNLFLSNPSLAIISNKSIIWDKLQFLFKKFLFTDEDKIIWNNLIRLQISTLLVYGFYNLAIKILFDSVSSKDCINDEIVELSYYLLKNSKDISGISNENNSLLNNIEKIILSDSRINCLSLFLNYKCTPTHRKTVKFNKKLIQDNLEKCFLNRFYYDNQDSNVTIFDLFLNNKYIKSKVKYSNLLIKEINKYDLLICCSTDLLFNNGYKSKLIINSVNINQRIKILVCFSLISILSVKDLIPDTIRSIQSLFLIISTICNYIKVINKVRCLKSTKVSVSKLLDYESDLPIYLTEYNANVSLERWKLLLNVLPFNDIVPLINKIDQIYSKNNLTQKPNLLFSYLEIYTLTKNFIDRNHEIKIPVITSHHIKAFMNYPMYYYKTILQIFIQSLEQESIRHLFISTHLLVLKNLSFNSKITDKISFIIDNNQFKAFTKIYKLLPKYKTSIIRQVVTGKKCFVDLFDFSKVWSNYWLISKFIKFINKNLLSSFSYKLLNYIFFINKKFPIKLYKSLITLNGNCISLILNDLFRNLSENVDYTIKFVGMLPNDKQKLEIIALIISHLAKDSSYNDQEKRKLFTYLNTLILTTKFTLFFPNFENRTNGLQTVPYNQILIFVLDLFMDSDYNNIDILILNILRPLKINFFELLSESITSHLSELNKIKHNSSTDLSDFIKSIFEKADSNIFSSYGVDFYDFIFNLYNSILKNMENNYYLVIIFSIELVSRNLFDILLLNKLTNQLIISINALLMKINIHIYCSDLAKFLGGISNLTLNQHSKKLNCSFILEILYLLLYYIYVLNKVNISLMDEHFQARSSNNEILIDHIIFYKKIVSEFTLNMVTFISTSMVEIQFFNYWFIFGETLIDSNDQKLFFDRNKNNLFIGLNSPFRKHALISITYARMEEVLASKYYKLPCYNIRELICCFNIILNSASYVFLGTRLFSNLIIPVLINTKKEDHSLALFGKRICKILNINYSDSEELAVIGVFFKTLLIYKKKIINHLIPQLFALKSHNIVAEIVASENNILRYSHISGKYMFKILSKLFDKFYYINFDRIRIEIEDEISNGFVQNYLNSAVNNFLYDVRLNELSGFIYQKLLSKFYAFLFAEKQHFFEIKLVERKVISTANN
ncbi:uncharacterized protein cubi_01075 [Cryptosporidium ubiquitum]|uniref:Uncharacterized protein n=1 Tax=Cryptosporidium ubiquitum TaxID=857276 RepID=A0A1J4MJN7_9CRYT|nr:uncharacterized protein cubi_01075 [Cryptosporidium ubiquitum]OII74231.1 hypothetical protein cubi_01075 [Cryptosporidium ubiquitum]